jgi:hypothetical protein
MILYSLSLGRSAETKPTAATAAVAMFEIKKNPAYPRWRSSIKVNVVKIKATPKVICLLLHLLSRSSLDVSLALFTARWLPLMLKCYSSPFLWRVFSVALASETRNKYHHHLLIHIFGLISLSRDCALSSVFLI